MHGDRPRVTQHTHNLWDHEKAYLHNLEAVNFSRVSRSSYRGPMLPLVNIAPPPLTRDNLTKPFGLSRLSSSLILETPPQLRTQLVGDEKCLRNSNTTFLSNKVEVPWVRSFGIASRRSIKRSA